MYLMYNLLKNLNATEVWSVWNNKMRLCWNMSIFWGTEMHIWRACSRLPAHKFPCSRYTIFFFFSVLKMSHVSEKGCNIHLWWFEKFPRLKVCSKKKSIFGKENGKRSHVAWLSMMTNVSLQDLLRGFPGLWWRPSHLLLWLQTWRSVFVLEMCNMYEQPWALTDCGILVSQTVAAKMPSFLDFGTSCIMFPFFPCNFRVEKKT